MEYKWRIFKHGWKEFCQWMVDYWNSQTQIIGSLISAECWARRRDDPPNNWDVEYFNVFGRSGFESWAHIMGPKTNGHFVILE